MTKLGIFIAAMALAGAAVTSVAADAPKSARLQTPLGAESEVASDGVIWACKADTCVAESDTAGTDAADACRGLARAVGPIAAFGSFDQAALSKCNRVAHHG